ncbi:MAG: hypothetical protein ABSE69_14030 [Roseiarcus sp.]
MVKFISVALVALMVSSAAVPAFAKGEKQHGGKGGGGGMHGLAHLGGGKGLGGKGMGAVAAMAIFGMALDAMSR